jgi:hypothetical protein
MPARTEPPCLTDWLAGGFGSITVENYNGAPAECPRPQPQWKRSLKIRGTEFEPAALPEAAATRHRSQLVLKRGALARPRSRRRAKLTPLLQPIHHWSMRRTVATGKRE